MILKLSSTGVGWGRVKEVLAAALEEQAERRPALLDELCAGDAELRSEVESLLQAEADAGTFIASPVLGEIEIDDPAPDIGRVLGPYYIEQAIGHGGMGTVYLARRADREFERRVAIKMIRRGMDSDLVIKRFRHERQILASLDHPHIASLFDGGTTPEGLPYFVMEYVAGTPIDRYADEHALTTAARIELVLRVLEAVQHAHDRNVVHRDLKPTNVLVTADGHPKLLDFGIAKLLDSSGESDSTFTAIARPMTPDYASPEQVRGQPVTPATDVYALGLLLYELLTGHRAYRLTTRTPEEIAKLVCEDDPERPSTVVASPEHPRERLDGALDEIILKALRKEPDQRYRNAAALADDLRRYLAEQPVSAGRDAWRYRTTRLLRRHRAALGVAALVIVAIAITAWLARSSPPAATGAARAPAAASSETAPRPSVAVVAFRNLSQRPADQWLSTAMAEMLTTELAGDGQVRVLPADRVARAERDLGADLSSGQPGEVIQRLRAALAVDYVVLGTFAITERAPARSLRIDVRAHRPSGDPIAVAGVGDESGLFTMIADAGRQLRGHLGLEESPPEATKAARAAFPQGLEATRLYAEGTARLRVLDAVAARDLLERAAALEPGSPLIQIALSSAWTALGYDGRSAAAAQKAFDAAGGLNREDRLDVEGRLYEAQKKWANAVDVHRTLWGFFSDNIEYGLRLAAAQTSAGQGKDALDTVAAMRGVAAPQNQDPRIDLAEATAFSALGDFPRELAVLQRAVEKARQTGSRLLVARARLAEGRSYYSLGQSAQAQASLTEARQTFLSIGDKAGAAFALNALAVVLDDNQDLSAAVSMYQEAFRNSEEVGDRRGMSAALNNQGLILKDQRRYAEAKRLHERALALRKEIGDQNWTAVSLSNIGVVFFEQDQFAEAAKYYKDSLAICREIGDKRGQVRALHNLAIVDRETGHLAAARAGYEESLATRAEIGDRRGGVMGRVELGIVLLAQGEIDAARRIEEEALALAREIPMRGGEGQALFQLGEIAIATGDLTAARRYHEQALEVRRQLNEIRTARESELALAKLTLEEGRPDAAARETQRILESLGNEPSGPLRIAMELLVARARLAVRDLDGAEKAVATARQLAAKTERIDVRRSLAMVEAEVDAARGRADSARTRLAALRAPLAQSGMVLAELERRLLLLEVDRADGRPTVKADARALEKDARARQVGAIVRRVQSL